MTVKETHKLNIMPESKFSHFLNSLLVLNGNECAIYIKDFVT